VSGFVFGFRFQWLGTGRRRDALASPKECRGIFLEEKIMGVGKSKGGNKDAIFLDLKFAPNKGKDMVGFRQVVAKTPREGRRRASANSTTSTRSTIMSRAKSAPFP